MKVAYSKLSQFKIFGLKIFELKTDYIERSTDKDDDDDEFYINLKDREIGGG